MDHDLDLPSPIPVSRAADPLYPSDHYYGLLTNPPGEYGLATYGNTQAVILVGSPEFRERGYNLFASMGGEVKHLEYVESRLPILRPSDRLNTSWFCLPFARIEGALRLYFYGQLYGAKGVKRDLVDEEGDFMESVCDNEETLWEEAAQLACDFIVQHMRGQPGAIPELHPFRYHVPEHGFGTNNPSDGEE